MTFFAKQGCSIMNCDSAHIRQVTSLCLPLRSRVMRNAVAFFPPSPHMSWQSGFVHSYPPLHFPTRLLCGLDLLGFMSKKWYSKLSLASFNLPSGVIAVTCNNIYIVTNKRNMTTHHMMWIYIKHENNETSKPSFIYDSIVLCEQDALGGLRVSTESVSDGIFSLERRCWKHIIRTGKRWES